MQPQQLVESMRLHTRGRLVPGKHPNAINLSGGAAWPRAILQALFLFIHMGLIEAKRAAMPPRRLS